MQTEGVYVFLKQFDSLMQDARKSSPPTIEARDYRSVVLVARGADAVVCSLIKEALSGLHISVVSEGKLPSWVSSNDLVILCCAGSSQESLIDLLRQARARNCVCITIASPGPLLSAARDGGMPLFVISEKVPTYLSAPVLLPRILIIFQVLGLSAALEFLPSSLFVDEKLADHVARTLAGKTPVIVTATPSVMSIFFSEFLRSVSGVVAVASTLSYALDESSRLHQFVDDSHAVVLLHDVVLDAYAADDMRRLSRSLEARNISFVDVPVSHRDRLYSLLQLFLFAAFVSYFLAIRVKKPVY